MQASKAVDLKLLMIWKLYLGHPVRFIIILVSYCPAGNESIVWNQLTLAFLFIDLGFVAIDKHVIEFSFRKKSVSECEKKWKMVRMKMRENIREKKISEHFFL